MERTHPLLFWLAGAILAEAQVVCRRGMASRSRPSNERTGLLAAASSKETELRERVIGVIDEEEGLKTNSNVSVGSSTAKAPADYSLAIVFVLFVLASLGNRLFQKRVSAASRGAARAVGDGARRPVLLGCRRSRCTTTRSRSTS